MGGRIGWFNFALRTEHEVKPIELKGVPMAIGTVHYHPYEHSKTPIPSLDDDLNWFYSSCNEVSDGYNLIDAYIALRLTVKIMEEVFARRGLRDVKDLMDKALEEVDKYGGKGLTSVSVLERVNVKR